jgi:hypothetical protein
MLIKLPNGLIDGGDHFNMARIDELRGKQQNYLSDKELVVGNIGHVPKILEDLVKSLETENGLAWQGNIKEALYKIPVGDIETILLRIRENTFGAKYYHETECPHCQHKNKDLRIDLDKLKLTTMPLADMMNNASRTMILPKCKLETELKPLYMKDLFDAVKMATGKQDELVTTTLALSIKRMGDKSKVTSADLAEIPVTDIMSLNDFAEKLTLEGSIDTDVQTECSDCKKEFEYKLNVYDPSFFYPTKGFKSTSS